MKPILMLFWRLCRLRASPEDVPFSPELLGLSLGGWGLLQALLAPFQPRLTWGQAMVTALLSMAVVALVTMLLLEFKGLAARAVQTLTSLVGIDMVLSLVALPLLVLAGVWPALETQGVFQMLFFFLLCWQLLAQGFVFHRALNVGPFLGTAIALMALVLTMVAVATLLPEVLKSPA